MKILLIEPPAVSEFGNQRWFGGNGSYKGDIRRPPLDLMMISGFLRKEGFDNTLVDANNTRKTLGDVKNIINDIAPDIIFISTSTCTIYKDLLVCEAAKQVNPSITTVALGTHAMAMPYDTFKESEFLDVIISSSEWEIASLNIVQNIAGLESAKGIMLRKPGGNIIKTEIQEPVSDLDILGFPSHDKIDKVVYRDPTSKRSPKTTVMGQKSCINNCSFCCQPAFFGAPELRQRSVGHFIEELKWVNDLGYREVLFNDATLTADREWAIALFEGMIKNNIDLTWNCSTRADRVDSEVLQLMKRAGCHTIAIGMESIDPVVTKNIRKNITPEIIKKAVSLIKRHDINTIVFSVVGFPGETKESINNTISFLKELDSTFITLGIAVPTPGTDFYRYVEEHDYLHTKDWSLYDPMKKPVFSYPGFTSEEIAYYSKYGLRQFYLRPEYIVNRLKSIRSFSELSTNINNFIGFVKRYIVSNNT